MTSAPDDSFLSSDQNTNKFLVYAEIEPQISYTIIRDFNIFFFFNIKKAIERVYFIYPWIGLWESLG